MFEKWDGITINLNKYNLLTYNKQENKLLPYPYSTNCKNYETLGHFSRNDCIRKCRINMTLEKCGVLPVFVNVFEYEYERYAKNESEYNCTIKNNFDIECYNRCPFEDCINDYYIPKIVLSRSDNYESGIGISPPSEPEIIYEYNPKIETIEFLCYIGSILGLWFGLSIKSIINSSKNISKWNIKNKINT